MTSKDRERLANAAEQARLEGCPGAAETIERNLSRAMLADAQAHASREAERHIAEHHRRHPWATDPGPLDVHRGDAA